MMNTAALPQPLQGRSPVIKVTDFWTGNTAYGQTQLANERGHRECAQSGNTTGLDDAVETQTPRDEL